LRVVETGTPGLGLVMEQFMRQTGRSSHGADAPARLSPAPGADSPPKSQPRARLGEVSSPAPVMAFAHYAGSRSVLTGGCPALGETIVAPRRSRPRAG
jgi:hypothetical protein